MDVKPASSRSPIYRFDAEFLGALHDAMLRRELFRLYQPHARYRVFPSSVYSLPYSESRSPRGAKIRTSAA